MTQLLETLTVNIKGSSFMAARETIKLLPLALGGLRPTEKKETTIFQHVCQATAESTGELAMI